MAYQSISSVPATSPALLVAAGAFAIAIFAVDTFTFLDIAIAVLYVVVVLMAANVFQRRGVLLVSAGCLLLTVSSFLLSHGFSADTALVRALVSLSAIVIATLLALKNQSATTVLREQAQLLDLTHDAVLVRGMNDVITYWNRGSQELYAGWGGGIRTSASEIVPDGLLLSCGAESGSRSCAEPAAGAIPDSRGNRLPGLKKDWLVSKSKGGCLMPRGLGGRRFGGDQRRERDQGRERDLVNEPLRVTAAMRSRSRDHGNPHQAAARPVKHFGTQLLHAALCNNGDAI